MKKIEMYEFVKRFNELEELEGFNFVKTIAKNYNSFKDEVELLDKAKGANKEYMSYLKEADELIKEYAEKDKDGKPVIIDNDKGKSYKIDEDKSIELESKLKALANTHIKGIETHKDNIDKLNIELLLDVDTKIHMLNECDLPTNISTKQIKLINGFIKWE